MVTAIKPLYYSGMNQEIELKLRLNPRDLPLLEQVLAQTAITAQPTLQFLNRYFDTPSMGLSQGGAALRIRQQNQDGNDAHIIQTLKTRGTSVGGLHQRMEWDWPLTQLALNLDLIQNSEAQDHLSPTLDFTTIIALFTTDFQRKMWLCQLGESAIEVVLDQGQVATGEHSVDLLELELELISGDAKQLFQLAHTIAQHCPVLMSDISKAERGYALLALSEHYHGIKKDWQDKPPVWDTSQTAVNVFKAFFSYQLSVCQRSLETAIWDKQPEYLGHAQNQLKLLNELFSGFTDISALPTAAPLKALLCQASVFNLSQPTINETAESGISLLWGQLTLACGHFIYQLRQADVPANMHKSEVLALQQYVEQISKGMR